MDRVWSLVLNGLVLTVLSVGLFRLAFPAPPRSSSRIPSVDGSPSSGKRGSPIEDRLPSVDGLRLVHAPTDTGTAGPSSTAPERETTSQGTQFPVTDLPFRLIGTVIGPSGYRSAVIEHTDSGAIRSLPPGRAWESLIVRRVEEERIEIKNTRRNRLEVLYLARTDTGSGGNGGGEQTRPARSEDDDNRTTRERPRRRSRSEDRPPRRKNKRKKDREAMQKLQEILEERRDQ